MMTPALRKAGTPDWTAIAALCADTGRQGDPVDDDERETFAEHWIGPYRELRPDWTFVAVHDKKIVGYLTGCPDTLSFEKERRRLLNPRPDSRQFFPHLVLVKLWAEHPAHLHMNVAADFRGFGTGAALIRFFFADLRKAGVPSAHVICGPSAAPFWERMAFRTEATVQAAPGVTLSAMARPVS
ncbi:MAG: GNAT family N-acetyltransferase [Elusimicrobia bacterium]|nr:GNAT family N-acetyltransferase [Elusimicrobiota bacterium]